MLELAICRTYHVSIQGGAVPSTSLADRDTWQVHSEMATAIIYIMDKEPELQRQDSFVQRHA